MPLFPDFTAIMRATAETDPAQVNETAAQLLATARENLEKATPEELAAELRNPTTQWSAVQAATISEALARIVKTCAL